jgi:acyl-CoA synthetase (NDP forming)
VTTRTPPVVHHDAGALLRPRNIVLVGASDRPRHWSGRVYENLRRFGFPGGVYPVNPKRETIWDVPCFPNVAALPEAPDHILSFLPADLVPGLLREAAAAGARSALVFAGGFGEGNDPKGRERARELAKVVEETGIALCGPNCLGNVAAPSRAVTLPDDGLGGIEPGPVAVIAQSGGLCVALNRILAERAMMPSYLISCGNQVGLAAGDYIRFMAGEPQVRAILLYLEQVARVDDFLDACRTAQAAGKAVLAVKIGGSDAGRAAALAHTGSLAGAVEAFDAVAGAAGVTRFDCLEDAVEALEYAVRAAPPRGPAVAVVSNSGALKSLVSESAARAGVPLARFSETTQARISEQLAADAPRGNPVDTKQTIRTENYLACLDALADDPEVGLILLGEEIPQVPGIERKESNLRGVAKWTKERENRPPLALFTPVNVSPSAHAKSLRAGLAHLPYLSEPDRAFRVVQRFNDQIARRTRAEAGPGPKAGAEALARLRELAEARGDGPRTLSEAQSKALLAPWGLRAARETLATDPQSAAGAADAMGYPVVIKGVAPTLAHKTEAGAVMLNLADAAAVKAACATIAGNVEAYAPGTKLEGFLVAEQVTGGAELALGISRDAEMGPVVMFGMGGVMLELYKDVAFGRAGLNRAEAAAMIDATRAGKLLAGWRGAPALDREAVIDAIVALGALAAHSGDIIEAVDINPLVALPEGRGALALDALVVLSGTGS